ncbi:conserved uncharacterized protein [Stigmatella aurantiaca DW4/3-1]|uniref:Conserved uncharacterized protein n=1 Tax=Stigmatella aurantiaca (strain DW4/3-1) TaxID=378806 RepID=E3FZN2_STIAD|nr:conserved uncharacterized protein [Stigmatella aurantiaca DW4/3-1]
MPFLTLNGLTVPVVEGRRRQVSIGQDSRAFSGAYRLGRRAVRREWEFRTGPLSLDESEALRRLIMGDGHVLSFDTDNYTSRGLGQASGAGVLIPGGKFGSAMRFASNGSGSWALQLGPEWTTMHYRYDPGPAAWRHYIFRSDGSYWVQGLAVPPADGLSITSGTLTLTSFGISSDFDDVVAMPFRVPGTWIAELYAWHSARPWSSLPFLTAGGTFAPSEVKVLGEARDGEFVEFVRGGTRLVGERFDFTLREV